MMKPNERRLLLLTAISVVLGCDGLTSSLERDPASIKASEIIVVTSDQTSGIPADGKSTARLTALIPVESSNRTVTFTSNAGSFVETGTREVRVFATINKNIGRRQASTLLKADTVAAIAIVRATVGEFYDSVSVRINK